jgi:hypothetical protein
MTTHELLGSIVPAVVLHVHVAAHVHGLAVVHRGDDIPRRPSVGHQVDRGKCAGHIEGLIVGGAARGPQAQPLGRHGHDHQHGHGIHLHAADAVLDRVAMVVAVAIGHGQPVIEEADVELAFLEHPADGGVEVRRPGVLAGIGMSPGGHEVCAVLGLQEAHHHHLSLHHLSPVR